MSRRPEAGAYLDVLDEPTAPSKRASAGMPKAAPEPKGPTPRTKCTFDLPADLVLELRVAVSEIPPKAIGGSISGLVARAVEAELERLRKKYNDGRRFESDEVPNVPRGPARRG